MPEIDEDSDGDDHDQITVNVYFVISYLEISKSLSNCNLPSSGNTMFFTHAHTYKQNWLTSLVSVSSIWNAVMYLHSLKWLHKVQVILHISRVYIRNLIFTRRRLIKNNDKKWSKIWLAVRRQPSETFIFFKWSCEFLIIWIWAWIIKLISCIYVGQNQTAVSKLSNSIWIDMKFHCKA